jgi:hypothetical protein
MKMMLKARGSRLNRASSRYLSSDYLPPLILFAVGITLNLIVVHQLCCIITTDSHEYTKLAENLVADHGFSLKDAPPYVPTAWRVPLYSFILAGLIKAFGSYEHIYRLQAVINTLTLLLIYKTVRSLAPRASPYLIILCILIFSLPTLPYAAGLLSEVFNGFFICLGTLLLIRDRYLLAGLSIGLAALLRPEALPFILILAVALRSPRRALPFILAAAVLIVPWLVRNYYLIGSVGPLDPICFYRNLVVGTSPQGFDDPVFKAGYNFEGGVATAEERSAYIALVKRVYYERWRAQPLVTFNLRWKPLLRVPLYGLENFIPPVEIKRLLLDGKYLTAGLRLLSMLLYGPVFLGFAFVGFWRSGMKARLLAIHFMVVMIIGLAIYIEPRYLVTSQLQLIPLFVIGLSASLNYYKGRSRLKERRVLPAG